MSDRADQWWGRGLFALAILAMAWQSRTLYIFPVGDSLNNWYGDESWLISEERTQIETGISHHPYALGATINHQVGLFLGNTWLTSTIYGIPAMVFAHSFPLIAIGRTVTVFLAFLTLLVLYVILVRWRVPHLYAGFTTLLLVTTPAFTLASHSARMDLLLSLGVMIVAALHAELLATHKPFSVRIAFAYGFAMMLVGFIIWPHMLTLLLFAAVYTVLRLSGRRIVPMFGAALGAIVGLALLCGVYYALTGELSAYGTHSQHTQFAEVSAQKPIAHLFSRSVQWTNLIQRFELLKAGAPMLSLAFIIAVLACITSIAVRHPTSEHGSRSRELFIVTLLILLGWLLFQGSVPYYLSHILCLVALASGMGLSLVGARIGLSHVTAITVSAVAISLMVLHVRLVNAVETTSRTITEHQHRAIRKLEQHIHIDATTMHFAQPRVLAELPCAPGLELDTSIALMVPSFLSFPERDEPAEQTLTRFGVRYVLRYKTANDSLSIASLPAINRIVESSADVVDTAQGYMFDMGRDYRTPLLGAQDTMILYRLRTHL